MDLAHARRKMTRRKKVLIGLSAFAALLVFGCTVSDDPGRARHPLRYKIEQTSGTAEQFEQIVRDDLLEVEQGGQYLAPYLEQNDFREMDCGAVAPKCYRLEVGSFISTSVLVALAPRGGPAEGWQLDDVRVGFTGP